MGYYLKDDYDQALTHWLKLGESEATMLVDSLAEGLSRGTMGLSKNLERSRYWHQRSKHQVASAEARLGHKRIYSPGYLLKYRAELRIIETIFGLR